MTGPTGAAQTFIIPTDVSVGTWPSGTVIIMDQMNTFALTVTGATGVTIETGTAGQITATQYAAMAACWVAANTWNLIGNTV